MTDRFLKWQATWPEWAKQSAAVTTNSLNELKAHTNTTNTPINMNTTPKENIVDHVHGARRTPPSVVRIPLTKEQIVEARTLLSELHELDARRARLFDILNTLCDDHGFKHDGSLAGIEGRLASEIGKRILRGGVL